MSAYGDDANDVSGGSVAAGDIDGDGIDGLIICAWRADPAAGHRNRPAGATALRCSTCTQLHAASVCRDLATVRKRWRSLPSVHTRIPVETWSCGRNAAEIHCGAELRR